MSWRLAAGDAWMESFRSNLGTGQLAGRYICGQVG